MEIVVPRSAALDVPHSILINAYHLLREHTDYTDLGPDWFTSRTDPQRRIRQLVRQLEALGHTVHLDPAA